jgi:hypothetical protein
MLSVISIECRLCRVSQDTNKTFMLRLILLTVIVVSVIGLSVVAPIRNPKSRIDPNVFVPGLTDLLNGIDQLTDEEIPARVRALRRHVSDLTVVIHQGPML